ncbi:MAG: flagellar biosynthesis anti-sigma factor FlgM [Thermodesulfovibrionales bacterium]
MKIPERYEIGGIGGAINLQRNDKPRDKEASNSVDERQRTDQITVSNTAKEIARLQVDVSKIPEVRTDIVDRLQHAITSNTYNVKGEAVAGKILKEVLIDSFI